MSSLIYLTDPTQVTVATDTLATTEDGAPFLFTTKAFIVPHLSILIAGTGHGGFLGEWFIKINDYMVVRDVVHLDRFAPELLREIWQARTDEFSLTPDATTSVYHFGFSAESGLMTTYVYRSENGFESEQQGYGRGVKPPVDVPPDFSVAQIPEIMEKQRTAESALPIEERTYIGGEIIIHSLNLQGFVTFKLGRFSDYDTVENAIYSQRPRTSQRKVIKVRRFNQTDAE